MDKKPIDLRTKFAGQLNSVCRASAAVNIQRAEFSGSVKVASQAQVKKAAPDVTRSKIMAMQSSAEAPMMAMAAAETAPLTSPMRKSAPPTKTVKKKGDQSTKEVQINTFAVLDSDSVPFKHAALTGRRGRVVTLCGTPDQLRDAAQNPHLLTMQLARTVKAPDPVNEGISTEAEMPRLDVAGIMDDLPYRGENILVGIIDVGGFDFAHPDFCTEPDGPDDHPATRFVGIWDQGGEFFDPPAFGTAKAEKKRQYGAYLSRAHLDAAMQEAGETGLPATTIMPQSQMSKGSHATHVASIAAGNGSFASGAHIAGVLLSLPSEEMDPRLSFYDTTRIVHALDFLFDLAEEIGGIEGVVVNISLGTNGGPHDSSAPMSRWIDNALTDPGRCVCVAAGNSGQEAPRHGQDLGYMMGRIHSSGHIEAKGLIQELDWVVVGDGRSDISENEMEIWYPPQDRFSVQVKPPGAPWMKVVHPQDHMQNIRLDSGTFVSIYSELFDAGNAHNRIAIHLSPTLAEDAIVGITPGVWKVRLTGETIRDGRFHAWIERDDPVYRGERDGVSYWSFPSFFGDRSFVDECSISTLACGDQVIGVANLDEMAEKINISSSQGPTRDGRSKPDIAAPGTSIWAANGFAKETPWTAKTGTSMASPYAASVAAAMLSANKTLTAAQIQGIIRCSARPLPGRSYSWRNDTGFGAINPRECVRQAETLGQIRDVE